MSGLVTLTVCNYPMEALVIRGLLDQHGIPVWIANWNHFAVAPWMTFALGGIPIQIAATDLEDARTLLRHTDDSPAEACPDCGSAEVIRTPPFDRLLIMVGFGGYAHCYSVRRRCLACKHVWRVSPLTFIDYVGMIVVATVVPMVALRWLEFFFHDYAANSW